MNPTLFHPLDLSLLAAILRDCPPVAVDWLQDQYDNFNVPVNTRIADVLLLYARDARVVTDRTDLVCPRCWSGWLETTTAGMLLGGRDTNRAICWKCGWRGEAHECEVQSGRLLDSLLPHDTVLARYLTAVGRAEGEFIARHSIQRTDSRDPSQRFIWFICLNGQSQAWKYFYSEVEAQRRLKQEILTLFTGPHFARTREWALPLDEEKVFMEGAKEPLRGMEARLEAEGFDIHHSITRTVSQEARTVTFRQTLQPVDWLPQTRYGPSPLREAFAAWHQAQRRRETYISVADVRRVLVATPVMLPDMADDLIRQAIDHATRSLEDRLGASLVGIPGIEQQIARAAVDWLRERHALVIANRPAMRPDVPPH